MEGRLEGERRRKVKGKRESENQKREGGKSVDLKRA